MEILGLKSLSHEDLSVEWLKPHEAHFSRDKTLEAAYLTGIPREELGVPSFIVEPPKHRTSIVRIKVAIPAQLRTVDELLESKNM